MLSTWVKHFQQILYECNSMESDLAKITKYFVKKQESAS